MSRSLRWIFQDLLLHKRFTILFILNLALGLTGFVTLDSFRFHLENSLSMRSQLVLGADIGMSSRQPLTDSQIAAAQSVLGNVASSKSIETYTMVASTTGDSRLVQIKAIDNAYPFYGAIHLEKMGAQTPDDKYDILSAQRTWVYPEVLQQLSLQIGDDLKVGSEFFKITDVVTDDSASGFSTSMAPRIYIGLNQLKTTGLVTAQSLAWYSAVFKKQMTNEQMQSSIDAIFEKDSMDESVRVYSHKSVSEQMSRLVGYLSDYLGLVSIAAIFLASIGATFLFRSYISSKIKEIAIFRSLGMSYSRSLSIYIWQVVFLGTAASLVTFLFSILLTPVLTSLLAELVSVPIELTLRWQGVGAVLILGILGSLFICLPMLVSMKGVKPAMLFQSMHVRLKNTSLGYIIHFFAIVTLWLLSVWQSNSWLVGSSFIGLFLLSGVALGTLAYLVIWIFDRYGKNFSLIGRMALRSLARQPKSTVSCFLALGMGIMLLNIIPQIESSLQMEIEHPEKSKLPSFFLFDIQDDQIEGFKKEVIDSGEQLGAVSPMIRSRLLKVNGVAFEKANANKKSFSREEQAEARFRNRGFNLSYRAELDDSEELIEGVKFSGVFDAEKQSVAEVSVETRFADRLGLNMGDLLTFEIQGILIEGKIINLRSVKWTSFQPNFFIQFQPGVLEEAPKTYVASIVDMPSDKKIMLQNRIVKKFPNISMIDVTRIVKRLLQVSEQMSFALQFMAILCLIVGFLVMYSISSHQALQRRRDINLIKVLGAPYATIRNLFVLEFSILAALAGFMGIILSVAISFSLSSLLFDSAWSWSPLFPLLSLLALISLVSILAYFSVAKVLKSRASFYL